MEEAEQIVAREVDPVGLRAAYRMMTDAPRDALKAFADLASRGSVMSLVYLGWMYQKGIGGPVDLKQAEDCLLQAVNRGSTVAASMLGVLYWEKKNYLAAEKMFEKADIEHNPRAIFHLGCAYVRNASIRPDIASPGRLRKGIMLLQQGYDHGHPSAGLRLAVVMASGKLGLGKIPYGILLWFKAVWDILRLNYKNPTHEFLLEGGHSAAAKALRDRVEAARKNN